MDTLAAFDVDNTLTTRDCVLPFMRRVAGDSGLVLSAARHGLALSKAAAGRDRDRAKASMCRSIFAHRSQSQINGIGTSYAEHVFTRWMRPDTLGRLQWHQRQGHQVALVSASLGAYLHPLGTLLGVNHVVCTELEAHGDVLTGELDGGNCRGTAKVERLLKRFGSRPSAVWAYGDSAGDRELLAWADHATLVGRAHVGPSP